MIGFVVIVFGVCCRQQSEQKGKQQGGLGGFHGFSRTFVRIRVCQWFYCVKAISASTYSDVQKGFDCRLICCIFAKGRLKTFRRPHHYQTFILSSNAAKIRATSSASLTALTASNNSCASPNSFFIMPSHCFRRATGVFVVRFFGETQMEKLVYPH